MQQSIWSCFFNPFCKKTPSCSAPEGYNPPAGPPISLLNEKYKKPPNYPPAFPGLQDAKPKTPYGGGNRKRWMDGKGRINEWDYRKGEVEIYDPRGKNHKGGFDPDTGEQTTPPDKGRNVEP
jgi:Cytotoxic